MENFQPIKKPRGRELAPYQKEWNRSVSSMRVQVENFIGSAKIMRMANDECRVRRPGFIESVFHCAAALHNLRIGVKLPLRN